MFEFLAHNSSLLLEGILQTLYMTLASAALAYVIGLPLGVLLAVTSAEGIRPLRPLSAALGFIVNIFRSVPFLILLILVIPLTRILMGTSLGPSATIVPLTIAAAPFVARLVEASLAEVDQGVIEAAWSMGASPLKIITKVLLPEARSSLLLGATIAVITILGYSAMSGIVGGGGLGDIAIRYGYYRYQSDIMIVTVALLVIIVMVLQALGERWARLIDKNVSVSKQSALGFFGTGALFQKKGTSKSDREG
jgi:D-methionine transport system permease protein